MKKELNAVHINFHEVQLPTQAAKEIDELWRVMLPGTPREKVPPILTTHTPIFDAWARHGNSIDAGRIPMAAYDTPIYHLFVEVIKDLRDVCDRRAKPTDPVFFSLPDKIRALKKRL